MESAKTKKSYPSSEESEFVSFRPEGGDAFQARNASSEFESLSNPKADVPFSFGTPLVEAMRDDPSFKAAFSEAVEEAALSLVESKHKELFEVALKKAEEAGFEEGLRRASEAAVDRSDALQRICTKLLDEKSTILKAHEENWLLALKRLMEVFGVPDRESILKDIGTWLKDSLREYEVDSDVRVMVDKTSYKVLGEKPVDGLSVHLDESLERGQFVVRFSDKELMFSSTEQWNQVLDIVGKYSSK